MSDPGPKVPLLSLYHLGNKTLLLPGLQLPRTGRRQVVATYAVGLGTGPARALNGSKPLARLQLECSLLTVRLEAEDFP